jgi:hypothetical protein
MDQESSKSMLEQLPTELVQAILSALPDIVSLKSAALTGPHLYHAFLGAEQNIISQVLLRQFNPALLHDALAAEESSRPLSWSKQQTLDFLLRYFDHDKRPLYSSLRWKLSEALLLAKLYDHVHFFASDLGAKFLARNPISGDWDPVPRPASSSEMDRIKRTFYRFEIYCNLFRDSRNLPLHAWV